MPRPCVVRGMRRLLALLILIPGPAPARAFDPVAFFTGSLEGKGKLNILMRRARPVQVHSEGRVEDGVLIVDQRVVEGAKPPKSRQWRIRAVAPGRYTGSLSEAAGPIDGRTIGDQLVLRFRMKHGLHATQRLTLVDDGQSAHNIMRIRRMGIVVATLDETIVRVK